MYKEKIALRTRFIDVFVENDGSYYVFEYINSSEDIYKGIKISTDFGPYIDAYDQALNKFKESLEKEKRKENVG